MDETTARKQEINPLLKLVLELGPLGVFFFVNAKFDIYNATGYFMAAVLVSLAVTYYLTRKLAIMPLITGIVVVVFGGLTLFLHDETFIKLKPTIVNVLFGGILLGGLVFGKSLLGYVFDSVFDLTEEGWKTLTLRWGLFFLFLAVLNEIVWRSFSTDDWVTFKVFGIMPITIVFTLFQLPLIQRHSVHQEEGVEPDSSSD